jgi:hypothetical protein
MTTAASEVYCEILKKLHMATEIKMRGMLTSSVLVVRLRENARQHTSVSTPALVEHFNM